MRTSNNRHGASSKAMLLQLPTNYVRAASLEAHLALSVCRSGQGNRHQFYRLIRMTYLSYLMWQDGYGAADYELYCRGEGALESAAEHAYAHGYWGFSGEAAAPALEIVRIYDGQLCKVARGRYLENVAKLERLLRLEIPRKLSARTDLA
ncbi:hypothetical protein [Burkholderia ubonensis]|uniref:hypothetical protein n=1 Tax=Burkholderia ubonensis TaxID=101571 RepID=UPI00114CA40A|nr:hypothetical protein [Burkholderia ubonensis]